MWRYFVEILPADQPVTFQLPEGARKHALGDPLHPSRDLGMTQRSIHAKRMDDTQGPAATSVRQNLPAQSIFVLAHPVAYGLRVP